MAETNGSGNSDRLGPIERILEAMARRQAEMQRTQADMQATISEMQHIEAEVQQDIKMLVRSQVVMGEALTKLTEAHQRTEQNLNSLILTVDEIIRGGKHDTR